MEIQKNKLKNKNHSLFSEKQMKSKENMMGIQISFLDKNGKILEFARIYSFGKEDEEPIFDFNFMYEYMCRSLKLTKNVIKTRIKEELEFNILGLETIKGEEPTRDSSI